MPKIVRIAIFSLQDQIRQKSFYILLAACILLVLLLRSCYSGNVVVNNQQIDNLAIAWHASKFAFHLIAGGMMFLTALLSMNIFTRDSQNGNTVLVLSKPIKRSDYVLGRIAGVWILVSVFMFILHLTIVIIAFMNTGDVLPEFLLASVICMINLLFLTILTSLLSLFLPDVIAAITAIGITGISFVSDSFYLAQHSGMFRPLVSSAMENNVSIWQVLWPKTAMLQYYASSFVGDSNFNTKGPVHPLVNICFYILISYIILIWVFNRKDV